MSDEAITPALTPEEWKAGEAVRDTVGVQLLPEGVCIGYAADKAGADWIDVTDARYVIGATCLYGQPFGFTWEDVDALRDAARNYWEEERLGNSARTEIDAERMESLADRIAALLPPREVK